MFAITNYDLFEELFNFIQAGNTLEDTLKEYGGGTYYIPSYKTTGRNDEIIKDFLEMQEKGYTNITRTLSRKYELTTRQIQKITKEVR